MSSNKNSILTFLSENEGVVKEVYSDPSNPYESIYIRAKISDGLFTVTRSECGHAPDDGGWFHTSINFDRINTEKVLEFLMEDNSDPFDALKQMINYNRQTALFLEKCDKRGIQYYKKHIY